MSDSAVQWTFVINPTKSRYQNTSLIIILRFFHHRPFASASINFIIRSSLCSFLAQICCRRFSLSRPLGGLPKRISPFTSTNAEMIWLTLRIKFGLRTHLLCCIAFLQEEIRGSFRQVWDEWRGLFSVYSSLTYTMNWRKCNHPLQPTWYHGIPICCQWAVQIGRFGLEPGA